MINVLMMSHFCCTSQWTAESDMRDTCFICSRNSYDFEHHGKVRMNHLTIKEKLSYVYILLYLTF